MTRAVILKTEARLQHYWNHALHLGGKTAELFR